MKAIVSKIELTGIDELKEYEKNPRLHSKEQIEAIANSIKEFGFVNPILVDKDYNIVGGHGRYQAAKLLSLHKVPTIKLDHLDEKQKKAYIIADNKLALNSSWDNDFLKEELQGLSSMKFDLSLLGFAEYELNGFIEEESNIDYKEEWKGMPEFDQKDKTAFQTVALHFHDQEAVDKFAELIGQKITDKTRTIWYPEMIIEKALDKRYADES